MGNGEDDIFSVFWKLSGTQIDGEPIYGLFGYRGFSLWWGFKLDFLKIRKPRLKNLLKESYKELVDRYFRGRQRTFPEERFDVILFNTDFFRTQKGERYFGDIKEELENRNIKVLEIYTHTPKPNQLLKKWPESADLRYIFSYMDDEIRKKVMEKKKEGKEIYSKITKDSAFQEFINNNFNKSEIEIIDIFIEDICNVLYPRAVMYTELFDKIIKETGAKAVCYLDFADIYPYSASVASKMNNIRNIWVLHGSFFKASFILPKEYLFENLGNRGLIIPNRVCAYGEYDKRKIAECNFSLNRIAVCGCPRFDDYAKKFAEMDRDKIIENYGLDMNKKFILWAPTNFGNLDKKGEREVNAEKMLEAIGKLGNEYTLLIKLHWDDKKRYLYEKIPNAHIFGSGTNLLELIKISDAVIIKSSTVGMEAVALGKPIIMLEFVKSLDISHYTDYGFPKVSTMEELVMEIKRPDMKEFEVKREKYMKDKLANFGYASEKIAEEIESLLKTKGESD